jgi:glycerol-3-phosphate acyltransferase PlsY
MITPSPPVATVALIASVLVCIRHRENIHRLLAGEEPLFRKK